MTYKPSPERKKEITKFKTAGSRWYLMTYAKGDPAAPSSGVMYSPWAKKAATKMKDIVAYGVALGRKQGKLPLDMTNWSGKAWWNGDVGTVQFTENYTTNPPVEIAVRFLEWKPAPPIVEIDEPAFEMKMAA